jgi:hypothetical protein
MKSKLQGLIAVIIIIMMMVITHHETDKYITKYNMIPATTLISIFSSMTGSIIVLILTNQL